MDVRTIPSPMGKGDREAVDGASPLRRREPKAPSVRLCKGYGGPSPQCGSTPNRSNLAFVQSAYFSDAQNRWIREHASSSRSFDVA